MRIAFPWNRIELAWQLSHFQRQYHRRIGSFQCMMSDDNLLIEDDVGNQGSLDVTLPNPGSYYIVVTNDSSLSGDQYTVTISADM